MQISRYDFMQIPIIVIFSMLETWKAAVIIYKTKLSLLYSFDKHNVFSLTHWVALMILNPGFW